MGIEAITGCKSNAEITRQRNLNIGKNKNESIFTDLKENKLLNTKEVFAISFLAGIASALILKRLKVKKGNTISIINQENLSGANRLKVGLFNTIKKEQPATIDAAELYGKKAGYNMAQDEAAHYKDVVEEFDSIYPRTKLVNPYCETVEETKRHLNGDHSEITRLIDRNTDISPKASLNLDTVKKERLYISRNNVISGDEKLVAEYKEFLGMRTPDESSFQEFLTHRSMNYAKENGISYSDLKEIKLAKTKGEVVEKANNAYHEERRKMYQNLWRAYPTEQFYRVIGTGELKKLLHGETIVSMNSKTRYGRECVDITPSAYYQDIFYGEPKFRISFKRKDKDGHWNTDFTSKIFAFRPEKMHYQIPSYSYKDVNLDDIRYWNGSDWQLVEIQ